MNQEPFKEEYWEDALQVLKREERKAFFAKWWPLSILVIALLGSGLYALTRTSESFAQPVVTSQPQMLVAASMANIHQEASVVTLIAEETATQSTVSTQQVVNPSEVASRTPEVETSQNKKRNLPQNNAATIPTQDLSNEQSTSVNPQDRTENSQGYAVTKMMDSVNQGEVNETTTNGEEAKGTHPNPEVYNGDGVDTKEEGEGTALAEEGAEQMDGDSMQGNIAIANSKKNASAGESANAGNSMLALKRRSPNNYDVQNQLWLNELSAKQQKRNKRYQSFNRIPTKSNNLRAWVGTAFLTGYGTEAGLIDWNPSFGLMIDHKLGQNWWAEGGLGLQMINGVRYKAHFFADELSFGRNSTRTTVATETLFILDAPFMLVRDINQRHAMFFGANIEYLINTRSQLSRAYITNGSQEDDLGSENAFGYTGGLSSVQFAPRVGYRYRFSKRVDVGIYRQFGWLNVNNGIHYRDNGNDFNTRWNVQFNFMLR
ncbi:MAG: hypothetical protein HRT74_04625 [Flavobacteriales bacterium]|nr:hypothetical protein [Flavobacteriales bacterium]